MKDGMKAGGRFRIECYDRHGHLKWEQTAKNLVTDEGLEDILDVVLLSGTQRTSWYVGLTDATPSPAAADTLASHPGWTEADEYSEGARQAYTGSRSSQTVSNSASVASFSITASITVGGAFLCTAATGTSGILLCVAAADGGNESAANGDVILVTYEFSAEDA